MQLASEPIERLCEDLRNLAGREVTENDTEWIGWRAAKLDQVEVASGRVEELVNEAWNRTYPVEEALDALCIRGEVLTEAHAEVMMAVLRGDISRDEAEEHLPSRTTDEVGDPFNGNEAMQKSFRQSITPVLPFQQEDAEADVVYCEECDVELDWTPSVLDVHNMRRHRSAWDDAHEA